MAFPQSVLVKLSSEAAGAVSITPVVAREMDLRELVEYALGIAGKDQVRILEILRRGTLVAGATRFRWTGWEVAAADLRELLATFPDADPSRPFLPERCKRATLRCGPRSIEIPKEAAAASGFFRRSSFWDAMMEIASGASYAGYSYRERADRFIRELNSADSSALQAAAASLPRGGVKDQILSLRLTTLELLVER